MVKDDHIEEGACENRARPGCTRTDRLLLRRPTGDQARGQGKRLRLRGLSGDTGLRGSTPAGRGREHHPAARRWPDGLRRLCRRAVLGRRGEGFPVPGPRLHTAGGALPGRQAGGAGDHHLPGTGDGVRSPAWPRRRPPAYRHSLRADPGTAGCGGLQAAPVDVRSAERRVRHRARCRSRSRFLPRPGTSVTPTPTRRSSSGRTSCRTV